ncbi:MAG TPA: DNA-3-methyladenine glycosylase I [Atribacteraceae bacterium]|nr:DNA-3-methyladenine glycosylase I [Atribacteraceae bacterium]
MLKGQVSDDILTFAVHRFRVLGDFPVFTDEAVAWAKDLKKRGFKFLGPTVVYSHIQAVGMVNDHTVDCFRHKELAGRKGW